MPLPILLSFALALPQGPSPELPSDPFELNTGTDAGTWVFRAPIPGGGAFVTPQGELVYSQLDGCDGAWSMVERFVGGGAQAVGEGETGSTVSRFVGTDPGAWTEAAPTFARVDLGRVWPGIRVDLAARERNVEKRFHVQPGASCDTIRIEVVGAKSLALDAQGGLVARSGAGELAFTAPIAWQEREGLREPVSVRYRIDGTSYTFEVGDYDRSRGLVIDPLIQSTYVGGTGIDAVNTMAVDAANGCVYVGGTTTSVNFPGVAGGAQTSIGTVNSCGFVARFSLDLKVRLQATYIGGVGDTSVEDLAIAPTAVYACGTTGSNNFPGVAAGVDPTFAFWSEGFVARFNLGLTSLLSSTYLGGTETAFVEQANSLLIEPGTGNVFVTGSTNASNFPGASGTANTIVRAQDAFIARLDPTLQGSLLTCFAGGTNNDSGQAIARDAATGHIFIAGNTSSTDLRTLTTLAGGAIPTASFNASTWDDVFVLSIQPTLATFVASSFLPSFTVEFAEDLLIDGAGNVFVAGEQNSSFTFPGLAGSAQPAHAGSDDAYVARFNSSLTSLFRTTYFGGNLEEWGMSLALHPSGDIVLCGASNSPTLPAMASGTIPVKPATFDDGFLVRLAPTLASFSGGTFWGEWSQSTRASAVAIHPANGNIYVAGITAATNFPGRVGGAQATFGGGQDGIVTLFDGALSGPPPGPMSYCTAGTSTHGCQALITANANPSATLGTPCTVTVSQIEGQVSCIVFYSNAGRMAAPWCGSGPSYLCVPSPRARTPTQNTGGTNGGCDGSILVDWNAWAAAHPASLGLPMFVGEVLDFQAWYRDSGACMTTSLSNAVELTVGP